MLANKIHWDIDVLDGDILALPKLSAKKKRLSLGIGMFSAEFGPAIPFMIST